MTDQQRPHEADKAPDAVPTPDAPDPTAENEPRNPADQPTTALPAVPPGAPSDAPVAAPLGAEPPHGGGLPPAPPGDGEPPQSPESESYQRWVIGGLIAFLLFITIIGLLFLVDDDDDDGAAEATATSALPTATTAAVAATETPTATPAEPTSTVEPTSTATELPEPTATEEKPEPTVTPTTEPPTATPEQPTPTPTSEPEEPTPTPKPEPTPTEEPGAPEPTEGTLAYTADWSAGAGNWGLEDGWAAEGGVLIADGAEAGPLLSPFAPTDANYAVEAQIAIVGSHNCDEVAGVFARASQTQDAAQPQFSGYAGGACAHEWRIEAVSEDTRTTLASDDRPLDTAAHTYRLEVNGDQVRLFIDGKFAGEAEDSRISTAGGAGLYLNGDADVTVRSFRVYMLGNEG